MTRRVSLKDIARELGISTALVSYVLNGREKEMRVGSDMAGRIRKVAGDLGYKPNLVARSLRRGSTMTIGLILADIANPFFGQLARVIEDEAGRFGYTVIFGSSDERKDKSALLMDTLTDRQVDGFILVPAEGSEDQITGLIKKGIPVVLVDRYFPGIDTSYVALDNYQASYHAVSRMIDNGYRKIGIIAYKSALIHMQERISGYSDAMRAANLQKEVVIREVRFDHVDKDIRDVIEDLVIKQEKAEALYFATNSLSIAGLYCITSFGIKIPDQLAVMGFDGNESFDFFYSPVSYVEQPIEEMGKESVRILVDLLKGSCKTVHALMKHRLIMRESTGSTRSI